MQMAGNGSFGKILAVRLGPGEDILEGLMEACNKAGINNGVILTGIGSMNGATYFNPVPLPDKKAGYGYGEALVLRGPIELISMNGMVCRGDDDKTLFHIHCSFSDQYGNGYGGHLIEGNKVLLTVEVVIGELAGINMGRRFDEALEVYVLNPTDSKA